MWYEKVRSKSTAIFIRIVTQETSVRKKGGVEEMEDEEDEDTVGVVPFDLEEIKDQSCQSSKITHALARALMNSSGFDAIIIELRPAAIRIYLNSRRESSEISS